MRGEEFAREIDEQRGPGSAALLVQEVPLVDDVPVALEGDLGQRRLLGREPLVEVLLTQSLVVSAFPGPGLGRDCDLLLVGLDVAILQVVVLVPAAVLIIASLDPGLALLSDVDIMSEVRVGSATV